MADFTALKTAIQNAIKQNGNEEITGNILQDVLLAIVSTLGDGSINDLITALGSEATTRGNADTTLQQNINAEAQARQLADSTLQGGINTVSAAITAINNAIGNGCVYAGIATPSSTPASGKVFYLALTAGTYTNYGGLEVSQGINILKNNGSTWSLDSFLGIDNAPTPSSNNLVKSGGVFDKVMTDGSAFDISAHFASGGTLATYANLSAALTALNTLSAAYKKGGMSIKFVQSSDNKYVQFRYMSSSTTVANFINAANWQGVDDEPTANSNNLVKSGGVYLLNKKHNIYNVNSALNTPSTYYTLAEAIAAVPVSERRSGIVLSYRKSQGVWEYAQFNPVYTENNWNNIANWTIINSELTALVANHTTKIEELNNKFGVYNLNKAINTPSTYYTLAEAIAAVPEVDRKVNMILSFRSSSSTVEFAQYLLGSLSTSNFTDVSNWYFWSNGIRNHGISINTINSSLVEKAEKKDAYYDYTSLASHDTVYRINSATSPTTIDLTGTTNTTYFGVKIPVKAGDIVSFYGRGGSDKIRLWAISDNDGNLLDYCKDTIQRYSEATRWDINSGPLTIVIPTNGKYFLFNSSATYPFRIIHYRKVSTSIFDKQPAWIAFGDSITNGTTSKFTNEEETATTTETADNYSYAYFVSKLKKCRYLNWGIGGMGYLCPSTNSNYPYNMKQLIDKITNSNDALYANLQAYDVVTIALGINDYKGAYNLGSMDDAVDSGTSVVANMRYTIEKIIETNPNIKIFVITPMNARGNSYTLGDYSTNYAIGYAVNGKTLQDFCDAMIQVCNYYGIQYINQTNYSVVNRRNIAKTLPDGVHPSKDIQKQIAKELAEKITFDMNWI